MPPRPAWIAVTEQGVPADDAWLAPAERARQAELAFPKRRAEYRLRRWAGKQAVARLTGAGGDPARVAVLNRPGGEPYVLVDGEPLALDVSLTDRSGCAVCAVSSAAGVAVGVDLELVEPRSDAFVEDFLTGREAAAVRALPAGAARDLAVTLAWSAKESALKVLRTGLRADTRSVDVHAAGPEASAASVAWVPLVVHGPTGPLTGWWRRHDGFVLTVVTSAPTAPPTNLRDDPPSDDPPSDDHAVLGRPTEVRHL